VGHYGGDEHLNGDGGILRHPRSIQFWDSTRVRGGPPRASLPARAAATASSRQARGSV
jgi:hypothetical protein